MATTPNGTTYTPHVFQTPDGYSAQWSMDDTRTGDANVPTIFYTHGSGGGHQDLYLLAARAGLRNWLMDNGWAVVEGAGAGSQWGGQAARDGYVAAMDHAVTQFDVGRIVVLARSMGGLVGYWLATQSPYADGVDSLIVNSGTTDLIHRYTVATQPVLDEMNGAYGLPAGSQDVAAFQAVAASYDPMQFPHEVWAGKRVLQMWGTDDTTVPAEGHAIPWINKYGDSTAETLTDIRQGGNHTGGNGSDLQTPAMTSFLDPAAPAPEPVASGVLKVRLHLIGGGPVRPPA